MRRKAFSSWSGGKECSLATHKAILQGYQVKYLLNFTSQDGQRSRSHGISPGLLNLQAKAIGIPLIQVKTSWEDYEANLKRIAGKLKNKGVEAGIFGDMDLEEHKQWVEKVCGEIGIKPLLPLWAIAPDKLLEEFWQLGFRAVVVATRLEKDLAGRNLDRAFLEDIKRFNPHSCGEHGEYHTFVTDGPIFKRAIEIIPGRRYRREDVWFTEVLAK